MRAKYIPQMIRTYSGKGGKKSQNLKLRQKAKEKSTKYRILFCHGYVMIVLTTPHNTLEYPLPNTANDYSSGVTHAEPEI